MSGVRLVIAEHRAYFADTYAGTGFVHFDLLRDSLYTNNDVAMMLANGNKRHARQLEPDVAEARRLLGARDSMPTDPLSHTCPRCNAPAGRACSSTVTGQRRPPHTERRPANPTRKDAATDD